MAVPENIPTSFVPRPSVGAKDDGSTFAFMTLLSGLGYLSFFFAIAAAAGVFLYGRYLNGELAQKNAALATAEASLDQNTIAHLLRLSQRFSSAKILLNGHPEFSSLLALLESVTPKNVRFNGASVSFDQTTGQATFSASGVAKNFNTLASASDEFSADPRLKNAIFSGIAIADGGTVTFILTATIDPKLIAYTAPGGAAIPTSSSSIATSSPPTASSTPPTP